MWLSRRDIFIAFVIFFCVLFLYFQFSKIGFDTYHDGLMLKSALDVSHGKMLFKETYTPYGALTTLIHSWSITLLGAKLVSLKFASSLFYAFSAVVIWLLARRFLSFNYALCTILLWITTAPFYQGYFYVWSSIYASFFVLVAQLLSVIALQRQKRGYLFFFLAGFSAALSFWCKQPYILSIFGVVIPMFILFVVKKSSIRDVVVVTSIILLGVVSVFAIFFVWLIHGGAMKEWLTYSIHLGYITGRVLGEHFSLKNFLIYLISHPLWLMIPVTTLIVTYAEFKKMLSQSQRISKELFTISILALAAFTNYYPVYDLHHLYWASTPAYVIFMICIKNTLSIKKNIVTGRYSSILVGLSLVVIGFVLIFDSSRLIMSGLTKITTHYSTIEYPNALSGIRADQVQAKAVKKMATDINTFLKMYPEKKLVVVGGDALALTFSDKTYNLDAFFVDLTVELGLYPFTTELDKYIAKHQPLLLLTNVPPVVPKEYKVIHIYPEFHSQLAAPIDVQ